MQVSPYMATGGHLSAQTAADGTSYVAFSSQACRQLTICNDSGTKLEARQGAAGVAVPIFDGSYFTFFGVGDASKIDVRRADVATTQVTVKARWEA